MAQFVDRCVRMEEREGEGERRSSHAVATEISSCLSVS